MRFAIFRNEENDDSILYKNGKRIDSASVGSLEDMASLLELSEEDRATLLEQGYVCYDRDGEPIVAGRYRWGIY